MRLNFFTPPPVPALLPDEMQKEIGLLRQLKSKEAVLQTTYEILTRKYRGYRLRTFTHFFAIFQTDVRYLWAKSGFLHCTNSNYLLKVMLLESQKFSEEDIVFKWTLIYFWSPHQYVRVRIAEKKWIDIDLWGKAYGIPFGRHAHGLHSGTMKAVHPNT